MTLRARHPRELADRRAARAANRAAIAAIPGAIAKPEPVRGTSYSRRERDIDFMLDVKELRCYLADVDGAACRGEIEADHAGARATSHKSPDVESIPLCTQHHKHRTNPARYPGCYFDRMRIVGARMRTWCDRAISHTQRAVAELRARRALLEQPSPGST